MVRVPWPLHRAGASPARRGMTLVELLTVVVLMGLVASLGIPALVRSVSTDPLLPALQELQASEAHARALAYGTGLRLMIRADGWEAFPLRSGPRKGSAPGLIGWSAPSDVSVAWTVDGKPVDALVYDAAGRSRDATVELRNGDRLQRWDLAGLTGEWNARGEPQP